VGRLIALIAAVTVGALAAAAMSLGARQTTVWTAALSSGQEVPAQTVRVTAAHGLFKGTLTGTTLKWTLSYAKLSGPATAAHIHMAAKGVAGAIVVPLCPAPSPCGAKAAGTVTGTSTISSAVMDAFKKHDLYVNVHTAKNPAGEIRGQLARG
jgi:CHRD domain